MEFRVVELIPFRESGTRRGSGRASRRPLSGSARPAQTPAGSASKGCSPAVPARWRRAGFGNCRSTGGFIGRGQICRLVSFPSNLIYFETVSLWEPPHHVSLNQIVSPSMNVKGILMFLLDKDYFISINFKK